MHNNLVLLNNSGIDLEKKFVEELESKISDWQKKNDYPMGLSVEKSDSLQYKFVTNPSTQKQLDKGVEYNLLMGRIDMFFQNNQMYKGKLLFIIYIGFSEEEIKRFMNSKENNVLVSNKKNKLAISPVEPKFKMEQLVLPDETKREIDSVVSLIRNINTIYYDWGFSEIDPVPRSIVNLWGPPGTGKTMAVHAISNELKKKVLVLNYADIESKYVGEAPKNLMEAFDIAEKEDSVIFFDEADSFLGKRITNVDSGSEQAINSLRSQLLMKLEEFSGIVFFATNLHENYDKAFESRILKHIEFKLPDEKARIEIIRKKLPTKAPYATDVKNENGEFDGKLLTKLSKLIDGFSGREIKNCILESLVESAVSENKEITKNILTSVFKKKKDEADSLKKKEEEKKKKITKQIKKNLKEKNYNIHKQNEDGTVKIIHKRRVSSSNKSTKSGSEKQSKVTK